MGKTNIPWATDVWNPITGCSHSGSPGCDHCYAKRMANRLQMEIDGRIVHMPELDGVIYNALPTATL